MFGGLSFWNYCRLLNAHGKPLKPKHSTLMLHFQKLESVVGQFALKYLNNKSLHAGYRNYALHKPTIANKLNHAETRISV